MSTMNHIDPGSSKTTLIVKHMKILDILMYVIFNFLSVSTEFNNYLNNFPPFDDGYCSIADLHYYCIIDKYIKISNDVLV